MPMHLTDDPSAAVPITPLSAATLPDWLATHRDRAEWLAATGFAADPGSIAFIPGREGSIERVLAAPFEGPAVWTFGSLPTSLPPATYSLDQTFDAATATAIALGWALGAYEFTRYRQPKRSPATLVWPAEADRNEVAHLARAMFLTRDLINTPAEDMGPEALIAAGERLGQKAGADVEVLHGDALVTNNYPCVHAVGRASSRAPALFDLRWGEEDAPKVTLVGKGVCFDTGGLNLKPRDGMLEMKKDMGGAAVVLGLAQALMDGHAPIRLRVLVPAVDNAIAGNAIRPRDILRTRSGKTVEISNTDAEGRLVLCDALSEADSESPALLIDCATLTAAAKVALGADLQALYCEDDAAAAALQRLSLSAGDPLWRMPLWRPYRRMIDGRCADLDNFPSAPFGGSIVAALYLAEFVSAAQIWVHLDIMAANPAAKPGRPEGGEATGLRALYAYVRDRFG